MKNKFLLYQILLLITILNYSCNKNEDKESESSLIIPSTGYISPNSYPNLELKWADEFEEENLNIKNWNFQLGNGCPNICGWGNNELEYYTKENAFLQNGYLIIEAKRENINSNTYTSSRINSLDKFSFHFGRVDIRAVLPVGQGVWPALWMLGDAIKNKGWPASGEIDIMEMIGGNNRENTVHGTLHWDNNGNHASQTKDYSLANETFHDTFHVFSIVWKQNSVTWLIDGMEYNKIEILDSEMEEFQQNFHFLFNIAIGGDWPGNPDSTTVFPQYLIIDYIRVFQ